MFNTSRGVCKIILNYNRTNSFTRLYSTFTSDSRGYSQLYRYLDAPIFKDRKNEIRYTKKQRQEFEINHNFKYTYNGLIDKESLIVPINSTSSIEVMKIHFKLQEYHKVLVELSDKYVDNCVSKEALNLSIESIKYISESNKLSDLSSHVISTVILTMSLQNYPIDKAAQFIYDLKLPTTNTHLLYYFIDILKSPYSTSILWMDKLIMKLLDNDEQRYQSFIKPGSHESYVIISGYLHNNKIEEAIKRFEAIPFTLVDAAFLHMMTSTYIEYGQLEKAIDLLKRAEIHMNSKSYILAACELALALGNSVLAYDLISTIPDEHIPVEIIQNVMLTLGKQEHYTQLEASINRYSRHFLPSELHLLLINCYVNHPSKQKEHQSKLLSLKLKILNGHGRTRNIIPQVNFNTGTYYETFQFLSTKNIRLQQDTLTISELELLSEGKYQKPVKLYRKFSNSNLSMPTLTSTPVTEANIKSLKEKNPFDSDNNSSENTHLTSVFQHLNEKTKDLNKKSKSPLDFKVTLSDDNKIDNNNNNDNKNNKKITMNSNFVLENASLSSKFDQVNEINLKRLKEILGS